MSTTPVETVPTQAEAAAKIVADVAEAGKPELTPEQLKAEVASVRAEAARYRTERNELREQLGKAKTPEEYQKAVDEWQKKLDDQTTASAREVAIAKHGLTEKLAKRLIKSGTPEEIEADAAELAELLPQTAEAPKPKRVGGGLNGKSTDSGATKYDPAALAIEAEQASHRLFG